MGFLVITPAWAQSNSKGPIAKVIAVIPYDAPPTYFLDKKTGKPAGFAVDIMDSIAKRAGLDIKYIFARDWTQTVNMVVKGEADLAPDIGINEEREKQLVYTSVLEAFPVSFFVRSRTGNEIRDGYTVGVIRGSIAYEQVKKRSNLLPVTYESFQQGLFDLLAGKIDAFACPAPTLLALAQQSGVEDKISVVGKPLAEIKRGIAVRRDNIQLLEKLNRAMEGFVGGPEYRRIYVKWYGKPAQYWTSLRIATIFGVLIVILISGMLVLRYIMILRFNRDLKTEIDRRRQAEEELRKAHDGLELTVVKRTFDLGAANEALKSAYKDMESFSYAASHDLKAPVIRIAGFSDILSKDYADKLDDVGKDCLLRISENASKIRQLIEDLLAFSSVSAKEIQKSSIDMESLTRSAYEEIKPAGRSIQLEITAMPSAYGDPSLIRQVLVNLLSNATKFTRIRETAIIEVGGRTEHNENIYYVRDNGTGFDMQFIDKLFGLFQRVHISKEIEGTGIGLLIVKRIIEKHGGRVWGEGKPGEGATFHFSLPKT